MESILQQFDTYRSHISNASRTYSFLQQYVLPIVNKFSQLAQTSLFTHPDLTSIALLLVILYISFVFLVKAWRLTISTVLFAFKAGFLALAGLCLLGAYNGVVNGDMSTLHALYTTAQMMLRFVGDVIIGGNTREAPKNARKSYF